MFRVNFKFKDITESAGVNGGAGIKTGISMVDINNDGLLDIFICKSGYKDPALRKKILYINNGEIIVSLLKKQITTFLCMASGTTFAPRSANAFSNFRKQSD